MKELVGDAFPSPAVEDGGVTVKTIGGLVEAEAKAERIQKEVAVRTAGCERGMCALLSSLSQCILSFCSHIDRPHSTLLYSTKYSV